MMPSTQRSASSRRHVGQQPDRLEHVAGHHRQHHVELEVAGGAAERDRGVVADHLRAHLHDGLGEHRVHLAGHDRRAGLQVGQEDLAEPGARSGAHPAQVVGDLDQADGDRAQLARRLDQPVAGALRLEVVAGLGQRQAGLAGSSAITSAANPAGVLMPVPTAVPPSGSSPTRGSDARSRSMPYRTCGGVPAELLPERHRRRVHQVGAAGLDHRRRTRRPCAPATRARCSQRRDQVADDARSRRRGSPTGTTSLVDCEAFTWSFGCTGAAEQLGRRAWR